MMTIDWSFLTRKKKYDSVNVQQTKLHRVLNLSDIVALGVSCTLGNGIYVLAGDVIGNYAGPGIIFSFLFAGLVTLIAGICYAEFGARVPRSGSGYVYIYVTIGEFVAFVLGWDLILEYVIGVSSGASAISGYVNSLANGKIFTAFRAAMPMNVDNFASFPDFLSFGFVVVITLLMVAGVKESTFLNKIFTVLNVIVIAFIFIAGLTKANKANWYLTPNANTSWLDINGDNQTCQSSDRCGAGGFLPFGFYGIVKGSAKCFYAFIGFDAIATTGEEVLNPKRNIPLSIVLTLATVATCYCTVSLVLTLMMPYYIIDVAIPIPQAFDYVQMHWATPVVTVGAMASLLTCLYASMFPMPRVVYSLASDGLIFKFLGYVLPRFKTPVAAAISSGLFAGILCLIFDLNQLIDMLSIGTLLAYSVVSICVVVLRYRPPESDAKIKQLENNVNNSDDPTSYSSGDEVVEANDIGLLKRLFKPTSPVPTKFTSLLVNVLCALAVVHVFLIALFMTLLNDTHYWYIYVALIIVFVTGFLMISFIISRQPQDRSFDSFKVPFVYFLPFMSVLFNIYLIMALSVFTWLRFAVWFVIGLFVYFFYGRTHSTLAKKPSSKASQVSF